MQYASAPSSQSTFTARSPPWSSTVTACPPRIGRTAKPNSASSGVMSSIAITASPFSEARRHSRRVPVGLSDLALADRRDGAHRLAELLDRERLLEDVHDAETLRFDRRNARDVARHQDGRNAH